MDKKHLSELSELLRSFADAFEFYSNDFNRDVLQRLKSTTLELSMAIIEQRSEGTPVVDNKIWDIIIEHLTIMTGLSMMFVGTTMQFQRDSKSFSQDIQAIKRQVQKIEELSSPSNPHMIQG